MELYEDLYFDEVFEERDPGLLERIADTMDVLENVVGETALRFKDRVASEKITITSSFDDEPEVQPVVSHQEPEVEREVEPEVVEQHVEAEEVVEPSEAVETATQLLEEIKPELVVQPEAKKVEAPSEDDERYQRFQSRFEKLRKPEYMEQSKEDEKDDLDF